MGELNLSNTTNYMSGALAPNTGPAGSWQALLVNTNKIKKKIISNLNFFWTVCVEFYAE